MVKDATSTGSLAQAFLKKAASLPAILVSATAVATGARSTLGIVVPAREAPLSPLMSTGSEQWSKAVASTLGIVVSAQESPLSPRVRTGAEQKSEVALGVAVLPH